MVIKTLEDLEKQIANASDTINPTTGGSYSPVYASDKPVKTKSNGRSTISTKGTGFKASTGSGVVPGLISDADAYGKVDSQFADYFKSMGIDESLYVDKANNLRAAYDQIGLESQQAYDRNRDDLGAEQDRLRGDFQAGQAQIAESGFNRGKQLQAEMSARGLGGSGLQRAGDIQERIATGKQVSGLAGAYNEKQEDLTKAQIRNTEDFQNRKKNAEISEANAMTDIEFEKYEAVKAAEKYVFETREALKEAVISGDYTRFKEAQNIAEIAKRDEQIAKDEAAFEKDRAFKLRLEEQTAREAGDDARADLIAAEGGFEPTKSSATIAEEERVAAVEAEKAKKDAAKTAAAAEVVEKAAVGAVAGNQGYTAQDNLSEMDKVFNEQAAAAKAEKAATEAAEKVAPFEDFKFKVGLLGNKLQLPGGEEFKGTPAEVKARMEEELRKAGHNFKTYVRNGQFKFYVNGEMYDTINEAIAAEKG